MAQIGVDFGLAHVPGVLLKAKEFDVTSDPIAVGLFHAVGVMMITKYLTDLVHKLYAGIGSVFTFVFHDMGNISSYHGKFHRNFSIFLYVYNYIWKIIHYNCNIRKILHIS